jgi:DNA-binding MarR family transcriptional regulator
MALEDIRSKFIPRKHKVRISRYSSFGLTVLGKREAEEESQTGNGVSWDVLAYLDENGPQKPQQIAKGLDQSEARIIAVLERLARNGYVQPVEHN